MDRMMLIALNQCRSDLHHLVKIQEMPQGEDTKQLQRLGLFLGTRICVVRQSFYGTIVEVHGRRIALSRLLAKGVMVQSENQGFSS